MLGNLSTMCCGRRERKVSRDQWMVSPHPFPRAETSGSRSKMEKEMPFFFKAWARHNPVMPAPIMRTWGRVGDEGRQSGKVMAQEFYLLATTT